MLAKTSEQATKSEVRMVVPCELVPDETKTGAKQG
jgi:hypothetical protein